MRISVVDAGSNTVRLMVADAQDGIPLPVHTVKWKLRLAERVEPDGSLGPDALEPLVKAVAEARDTAQRWQAAGPLAFATAVVRDAPNRRRALRAVREQTGVRLCSLSGETEAELTFLAARRWMGWRAGSMALLDLGGGSLEVAVGRGRLPSFAASLPLGARRLTGEFFGAEDPPTRAQLKALRRRGRHELRDVADRVRWESPHTTVVTSRTFQQLARLCGAAPGRHGPFVERHMHRSDLRRALTALADLPAAERVRLPGISQPRAAQSLAGAVVGHTAMKLMGMRVVTICPWALREGVLLRYMEDGAEWWADAEAAMEPTGDARTRHADHRPADHTPPVAQGTRTPRR